MLYREHDWLLKTFFLGEHVYPRQGASLLCYETLLAKLSEGDMVATEAKYHNTCLCLFYKKVKKNNKESNSASICHDTFPKFSGDSIYIFNLTTRVRTN